MPDQYTRKTVRRQHALSVGSAVLIETIVALTIWWGLKPCAERAGRRGVWGVGYHPVVTEGARMKIQSMLAVAVLATVAQQGVAAVSCASLKSLTIAGAKITLAEDVAPNPEWKLPPSVFTGPAAAGLPGPRSTKLPFCRVALTAGKENHIEVWAAEKLERHVPGCREWRAHWRHKLSGDGNGAHRGIRHGIYGCRTPDQ